eukprot:TRINITY_DN7856_c0_g2_i1.p1 TRINITY_DN7856_c0_g2~~TRINITY_DN7856_c0_g2_i1.p1  ORF type:complete len:193 (+),score=45.26 TRINITY_DN7856_c0_g2_i1:42-620(+)
MTSKLDKALDDLVDSKKKSKGELRDRKQQRSRDRAKSDKKKDRGQEKEGNAAKESRAARKRTRDESPEVKKQLGRGGRLVEKRLSAEVLKAKGRNQKTRGTLGNRPTTILVSNIARIVDWDMLKELFQGAAGKIVEGRLEEDGTAVITFEKPNAASLAYTEFNGGELADRTIKVELLYDDKSSDDDGWTRIS